MRNRPPATSTNVAGIAGALAVGAGVARSIRAEAGRGPAPLGGLAVLGAGALLHAVSRTGGPLCRPGALLQPHAVWHVAAAAAVLLRHAR